MNELKATIIRSSRKRRILAFLIDHFVMSFIMVSIIFLILGDDFVDNINPGKMRNTLFIVMPLGLLLYFAKDSIKGTSIGKWILNITVRDENDPTQLPSFGKLFIRNIFVIIWPVEFFFLALSKEKKRLGDKVTNTIVIKNQNSTSRTPRVLALVAVGFCFFTFIFLFAGNAMKSSDAYKASIKEIENNDSILIETGEIVAYGMFPTGKIKVSGNEGHANILITVKGKKKNIDVATYLKKLPDGNWTVLKIEKQ